jgi:transposase
VRLVRDGASDREIAMLVGLNRRTVRRYRRWATEQRLLDGPLPSIGELHEQLQATLPVQVPPQQTSSVAAYQEQILAYRRQGLELAAIRARLEEQHGVAISYDALWRLVRRLGLARLEAFVPGGGAAGQ